MAAPFPAINLDARATPHAKALQTRLSALEDSRARSSAANANAARASTSTMATLSRQLQGLQVATSNLQTVTTRLTGVTDLLAALANVQYSEWQSNSGATLNAIGWLGTPASVSITSSSGRLEIGYGGSLNSGNGFFCYSVQGATSGVIVNRDTVQGNFAQRVGISGGAAFIGSSFNTAVISVPPNEALTVSVECYSASTSTYFFGASIRARVAP